jgi:hypothetical protein
MAAWQLLAAPQPLDQVLDIADREPHRPAEPQPGQVAAIGEGQDRATAEAEHLHRAVEIDCEHRDVPGCAGTGSAAVTRASYLAACLC